ncbi:riboflavin synthase [Nitrospina gracilis]|uniref:riboflavin synthase n=1 Tax=Nitrospina gracilis TaxID=35801 RepID=UPI001F1CBAAF|nr:riboflavin synthase [Nitrospina gracilis]MCF8720315.1 riboflavin synthase [Nitrospina gracilis Nb-211]
MFTGIIEALGTVTHIERSAEKARLIIETPEGFRGFELGESIACNGVCLTVAEILDAGFAVDLSTETLSRTSFKQTAEGTHLNLEKALTPNKKMSGHFVSGHVDQVGTVAGIEQNPGEVRIRFEHPPELAPFVIEKGSAAVDGISLTVFDCRDNGFSVSIIPFTWEHTNLNQRKIGDWVNIECDMIGKYVLKACESLFGGPIRGGNLTQDFLKQHGFV